MNSLDVYFLKQTIKLAKKGEGKTSPNPLVGALIVKDKEIIGAGFHECCGQAHAEINALKKAKDKAKGAVLYVNLEPCSHYGRTPPCTKSIIDSGIKKVVIGLKDPNPLNNGRGIKLLRKAGILVEVLKNNEEYIQLNEIFIKYITKKIPFLAVKAGQSLDGKIAARNGLSKWITNETSRDYAQYLRKKYDALMIGVNTLIKDNPILSCRYKGILRQDAPIKIIIDPELITPVKSNIFSRLSPAPVIIVTCKKASKARMELFNDMGVDMIVCPSKKNGKIDLKHLLQHLAEHEISSILVEGGSMLNGTCFDDGIVDKVYFFIAPKIIGGKKAVNAIGGQGVADVKKAVLLSNVTVTKLNGDVLVEGNVKYRV